MFVVKTLVVMLIYTADHALCGNAVLPNSQTLVAILPPQFVAYLW
jgi:hypothetical protein